MSFAPGSTAPHPAKTSLTLSGVPVGQCVRVERVLCDEPLARRLLEIGFCPDARVEIVARMWPGHDPIAVRVGGSLFALRRDEADHVVVQPMVRAPD